MCVFEAVALKLIGYVFGVVHRVASYSLVFEGGFEEFGGCFALMVPDLVEALVDVHGSIEEPFERFGPSDADMGDGVSLLIGGFPGWVGFGVGTEVFFKDGNKGVVDGEEALEGFLLTRETEGVRWFSLNCGLNSVVDGVLGCVFWGRVIVVLGRELA